MIPKQTAKLEIPSLRRCKAEEVEEGDGVCYVKPKRRKTNVCESVPLGGSDQMHGDEVYCSTVDSCCNGVSYLSGEVDCDVKKHMGQRAMNESLTGFRRPLSKSSRGRVQVLPSRFSDSVLGTWKKDSATVNDCKSLFDYGGTFLLSKKETEGETPFPSEPLSTKQPPSLHDPSFSQIPVNAERGEFGCNELNDFDTKMYSSSRSSVTSIRDGSSSPLLETDEYPARSFCNFRGKEKLKEKSSQRKDFYKPEDFVLGDIVWAKSGKKFPAWPAIVIDPLWQAPETVLRACVPGTICVMYFGYSKNGKQRVSSPSRSLSHPLHTRNFALH